MRPSSKWTFVRFCKLALAIASLMLILPVSIPWTSYFSSRLRPYKPIPHPISNIFESEHPSMMAKHMAELTSLYEIEEIIALDGNPNGPGVHTIALMTRKR